MPDPAAPHVEDSSHQDVPILGAPILDVPTASARALGHFRIYREVCDDVPQMGIASTGPSEATEATGP